MQTVPGTIVFLEKVFLKKRLHGSILRGVELFNLILIEELRQCGHPIVAVAHPSWGEVFRERYDGHEGIRFVYSRPSAPPFLAAIAASSTLVRLARKEGPFHVLLVGNAGNGIVPAIRVLDATGSFKRAVVISHREPQPLFLRTASRLKGYIVSVCDAIAEDYRRAKPAADVSVFYGIMNADRFHPAPDETEKDDGKVRFCVLGALDNGWKGADTAVEAFKLLPEGVRKRSELHLMAYADPPEGLDIPGVIPYRWSDSKKIPDFLRSMDVMLVPSRDEEVMRETFSQATVQGMLTGLPVLYSDLPVLREKFDAGGGLLFHDAKELAAEMTDLALHPDRRSEMGRLGRETALRRYVWDTAVFCRKYID